MSCSSDSYLINMKQNIYFLVTYFHKRKLFKNKKKQKKNFLPAWHCQRRICVIKKKNNVVLDITEIEYLFTVLKFSAVEYPFFFFFFYWNGLNSQT